MHSILPHRAAHRALQLTLTGASLAGCADPGTVRRPAGDDTAEVDTAEVDTAHPDAPAWSFAVFGDNQFSTTSCTSGTPERLAVPAAILDRQPTLVLHTGDLMDHGYEDGAYSHFADCYAELLGSTPLFPTPGNHDMGGGGLPAFKAYLEEQLFTVNPSTVAGSHAEDFTIAYEDDPNEYSTDFDHKTHLDDVPSGVSWETFYALRHANAVVISFEQGTRWWTNTPKSWLEAHLAAAHQDPTVDHLFVIMHHPMYSTKMAESSSGECIEPVREHYEPLFRQYDVTVVFAGHTHLYDRFHVPDDGQSTREDPPASYPHDGDSVHYLVTGGGGGPIPCDPPGPPPEPTQEHSYAYSQARGCGYHFTLVQVQGPRLSVEVVGVAGSEDAYTTEVWDAFQIE